MLTNQIYLESAYIYNNKTLYTNYMLNHQKIWLYKNYQLIRQPFYRNWKLCTQTLSIKKSSTPNQTLSNIKYQTCYMDNNSKYTINIHKFYFNTQPIQKHENHTQIYKTNVVGKLLENFSCLIFTYIVHLIIINSWVVPNPWDLIKHY